MVRYALTLVLLVLIFSGCNQPKPVDSQSIAPSWIMNPNQGGKIGAVGSANRVYDGKTSTKRQLAITRALDELSLQQGVKVKMSMTKNEQVTNDKVNSNVNVDATYSADSTVTAHIEDMWQDPLSAELFIWMVVD